MPENSSLDLVSKGFSVLDIAWGAVLDKTQGLPLGSTLATKYGPLASTFGGLAAAEKFSNSAQSSADLDRFFFEIAGQLPGVPGVSATGIAFVHEKIGEIFDGGTNEQQLLSKLLAFSTYLKSQPGAASKGMDKAISTIKKLQSLDYDSLQPSINIRQYLSNGTEFFTYQVVDRFGFTYSTITHLNDQSAQALGVNLPTGIVKILDPSTDLPLMEYHDSTQYDTGSAALLKESSISLSERQLKNITQNLTNSSFGLGQNSADYIKHLIDPGDYWHSFSYTSYESSSLNFSNANSWLWDGLWNATTTMWFLFEKTTEALGESKQVSKSYVSNIGSNAKWGSPIVIDLDGDGLRTTFLRDSSVFFDLTGDGSAERTAWLSKDDAFIAYDRNRNGMIDGVSELFGGHERGEGYERLAEFDSNSDGLVNSDDDFFDQLLVWQDLNQNGISDNGELTDLLSAGISELNVIYKTVNRILNGSLIGEESSAVINGTRVEMADIYFRYEVDVSMGSTMRRLDSLSNLSFGDLAALPDGEFARPWQRTENALNATGELIAYSPAPDKGSLISEAATSRKCIDIPNHASHFSEAPHGITGNAASASFEYFKAPTSEKFTLTALGRSWFDRWLYQTSYPMSECDSSHARRGEGIEQHWMRLVQALSRLDADRESLFAWSDRSQGADMSSIEGFDRSRKSVLQLSSEAIGVDTGTGQIRGFAGLQEGLKRLTIC